MKIDMGFFVDEVERAFRALAWYQAEGQNEADIRSWYRSGMITKDEYERLRDLNRELVAEYI